MRKSSKKYKDLLKIAPWIQWYDDIEPTQKYPDYMIVDMLKETVKKYPHYIAYEYFGTQCTFEKFYDKIEEAAKALKQQGIKEGDIVTICTPNMPQGIILFYAINMVGAIANMIHPLSAEKEIEQYLQISKSNFILTIDIAYNKIMNIIENTNVETIIKVSAGDDMKPVKTIFYWLLKGRKIKTTRNDRTLTWKEFIELGYCFKGKIKAKRNPSDPAVILYSGGTTGKPKGIVLSNKNFNSVAVQSRLMCDPNAPGDSILSIMPIFHSFGLAICTHTTLCIGMKNILIPTFTPKEFGTLIKKHRPNFIVGVPTLFEALLKTPLSRTDLQCATCVINGGDTLKAEQKKRIDRFLRNHGSTATIKVGYGLTESCGACCLTPTKYYRDDSIGIPFPDTIFKIVKIGTEETADIDEEGEICISGPTIMLEYLNEPEETAQTLKVHKDKKTWLHTGDIASMDKDGFIYFKQRIKRVIITSGYNVYPTYIEQVINDYPDVENSVVIGVPHPYKVQVAKAFIVLKKGIEPTHEVEKNILRHCERYLAKYSVPKYFEFRDSLPRTLVGKVAYKQLEDEEKAKLEKNN